MKKLLSILVFVLVLTCAFSVFADYKAVDVYVNNELLVTDSPAVLANSRTMVPLRAISEKLGCVVSWDAKTKTAEIKNDKTAVYVTIDNDIMIKKTLADNKSTEIKIDAPAMLYKSRTLIPLRAVSEALDAKVDWDATRKCALITTDTVATNFGTISKDVYKSEELGFQFNGKGMVVMNDAENVDSEEAAATVEEVDAYSLSEFSAYFSKTGSNVVVAVSPETEVASKDYLEYIRPLVEEDNEDVKYISSAGIGTETIAGYEFEKIVFRGNYSGVTLNLEYCAGKVGKRLVFVVISYADGMEADKQAIIKAFSKIEK